MSEVKMFSEPVPNVPWQDRPANDNHDAPIWRYTENPIIGRNPAKGVARIFNSAVVPFDGKFVGVFRGEQVNGIPYIYLGERMLSTGISARRRSSLLMRTVKSSCLYTHMIQDL